MSRTTTIELHKEEMKFSAGHFTIFSATHRENLHGHNFTVYVALTGAVVENGLLSDYGPLKQASSPAARRGTRRSCCRGARPTCAWRRTPAVTTSRGSMTRSCASSPAT
ncbi:6-pyruvoyl trahydropterin synthase family protein [Pyxidicoccus sp. 3LFB2]